MLEQTHLKCHQNTVPDSALSQMTSSAHLQVPERPSMKRNQPAGSTWSNQEISIPFNLSKNPTRRTFWRLALSRCATGFKQGG